MRTATAAVALLLATAACDVVGGGASDALQTSVLEETGTATLVGYDIVVHLDSGPVRLSPAADTRFFVCDDACEVVEEAVFRDAVRAGETVRLLGPNAELLTLESDRLPEQVWVVLDRSID